jgi:hypothetical protein
MDSPIIPQQNVSCDYDIAVLSASNVNRDSRILRQLNAVRKLGSVVCISPGTLSISGVDHISIDCKENRNIWSRRFAKARRIAMLGLGAHESFYWSDPTVRLLASRLSSISSRIVIANDLEPFPVAVRYGGQAAVVFDAHEYYPGQQSENSLNGRLWNRHSEHLCRRYIPSAALMATVAPGIAKLYNELCGVICIQLPNCPASAECTPAPIRSGAKIRLVHHGAYRRSRGIERLVKMVSRLPDRYELHLILTGDRKSANFIELEQKATETGRVFIHNPVSPTEIVQEINKYDIGVYILDPVNVNHRHALPNKFFEFIQARLAVAIGPSPEMATIVEQHKLGVVAGKFCEKELASLLTNLSQTEIEKLKENSHNIAPKYTAERVSEAFEEEIRTLLGQNEADVAKNLLRAS